MIERTPATLKLAQQVPYDLKIIQSKKIIKKFLENEPGYISFSGGKDSLVLMNLVKSIDNSVPVVFCDTGMEFPSVRENALKYADIIIKPEIPFNKVIEKYGYPVISKENSQKIYEAKTTKSKKLYDKRMGCNQGCIPKKWKFLVDAPFKISHMCCDVLKKKPFKKYEKETGRKPFIGVIAEESRLRQQSWIRYGCNAFKAKRIQSRPLMKWTELDIYTFLKLNKIKLPKIYNYLSRTGCMFCLFGILKEENDRFEILKKLHPEIYNYFWDKLNYKKIYSYIFKQKQLKLI